MTFTEIFQAYYTLYRGTATIPASTESEYTIGLELANEAVKRWANYDNTYWKELFTTLSLAGEGTTVATDVTQYDVPDDFREAGGHVKLLNSNNTTFQTYPILESQEVQFKPEGATFAYFTGSPAEGYVLNLSPTPTATQNGKTIQYDYYKTPTLFTTGSDVTEMSDPYFIVHRMLANRFRTSRNPYYEDALRDSENALGVMKMRNDSGTWANPFSVQDRSGTIFGA